MKYLLVLAVVCIGIWAWRRSRAAVAPPSPPPPPRRPVTMVACRHCGLHLPSSEAVDGALGPYCCAEHLKLAEPGHQR